MRAQLINILTLGAADGKGCFFPNGLLGEIVTPAGFDATVPATDDFPAAAPVVGQARSPASPDALSARGVSRRTPHDVQQLCTVMRPKFISMPVWRNCVRKSCSLRYVPAESV